MEPPLLEPLACDGEGGLEGGLKLATSGKVPSERMRMQCEQAFLTARQAQVDADARAEKLDVLKAEYYNLKTSSATTLAGLEATNASLLERVKTYERLEEELDSAVMQTGALAALDADRPSGSAAAAGAGDAESASRSGGTMQPYLRVPSSAQRRMQQCLGLAKDVLTAQRRAEAAEAELTNQRAEVDRLTAVLGETQRKLRQAGQPHNYLAEQVEVADEKRSRAEAKVAQLSMDLAAASEALATTKAQNDQLLKDLESLLSQRGSLDALRATLTRLLPPDLAPTLVPSSA